MSFRRYIQHARVAALGVAVALAPSAAWSLDPPVAVTPAGKTAGQHEVRVEVFGAAYIAAVLGDGALEDVFLIEKDEDDPASRVRITANVDASDPAIEVNQAGDLLVAYQQPCGDRTCIYARNLSADGEPGPTKRISEGVQPAMDSQGRFQVVWRRSFLPDPPSSGRAPGEHRIQTRSVSAAGVLGPVKNISPADGEAYAPRVVVNADGDALFVWLRDDGDFLRVQTRSLSAAGVLGPIQNISPAGSNADHPQVAMTAAGRAVIVWQRYDATSSDWMIETPTRSPAGALGAVVALSAPGADSVEPQVALDAPGDALFVWEVQALPNLRIQARHRSAAGVLKPIQNISAATGFAFDPQVARSADGDAVIVWTRNNGNGTYAVQSRSRADAGPLGAIQTLSTASLGAGFPNPRVVMNDDGDAVVVWGKFDGSNDRLWAAFGP